MCLCKGSIYKHTQPSLINLIITWLYFLLHTYFAFFGAIISNHTHLMPPYKNCFPSISKRRTAYIIINFHFDFSVFCFFMRVAVLFGNYPQMFFDSGNESIICIERRCSNSSNAFQIAVFSAFGESHACAFQNLNC